MEDARSGRGIRRSIHEQLQENGPHADADVEEAYSEFPEAPVLIGWVVVAEWMGGDGRRWLTKNSGDASGDRLTTWAEHGYLHEALHTDWPSSDEA